MQQQQLLVIVTATARQIKAKGIFFLVALSFVHHLRCVAVQRNSVVATWTRVALLHYVNTTARVVVVTLCELRCSTKTKAGKKKCQTFA